jgi:hypothetical protein
MKSAFIRKLTFGIFQIAVTIGLIVLAQPELNAQILANPSLEGQTGSLAPPSWSNCGGSPDTQILNGTGQGIFGINTPPQNGNSYVGFVTSNWGYIEAVGQPVNLTSGTAYTGSLALFRSVMHSSWNGTGQCQIWGGTSCSNRIELLWSSGTVSNLNNWQNYPISFSPTMNHSFIIFVNYFNPGSGSMNYFCLDNIVLNATILPVDLLSFEAEDQPLGIDLAWETVSLKTDCTFELEWSGDALVFKNIGTMQADEGDSQFGYSHSTPQPGLNYYRLRMIDANGDENYSEIRQVEHEKNHFVRAFPNPTTSEINLGLRLYESSEVAVRVLDAAGRLVHQENHPLPAGSPVLTLQLNDALPGGLYHLEIRIGNDVAWQNVTIQK